MVNIQNRIKSDFRRFSNAGIECNGWEDNFECVYEGRPEDRKGAFVLFDAWEENDLFMFRIFHIDKDLPITLKGENFREVRDRKLKYIPDVCDETGEEKSYGEYLTTIYWESTSPKGKVEVCIDPETYGEMQVDWSDGIISDFHDLKCNFTVNPETGFYKLSEILTVRQRQQFALDDRYFKLKTILERENMIEGLNALNMNYILGYLKVD